MLVTQDYDFNLCSAPDEVKYFLGPYLACSSVRNLVLNNTAFTQQIAVAICSFDVLLRIINTSGDVGQRQEASVFFYTLWFAVLLHVLFKSDLRQLSIQKSGLVKTALSPTVPQNTKDSIITHCATQH
jgi:hypothetical protein